MVKSIPLPEIVNGQSRAYNFHTPLIPIYKLRRLLQMRVAQTQAHWIICSNSFLMGMDIVRAMRLLVPPAWQNNHKWMMIYVLFDFNSMHMEPLGWTCGDRCYLTVAMQPVH